MNLDNCHKILGTSNKNNLDEIKKKYHQLAKLHHPDRGGNESDFRRITDAYKFLIKYKNNPNNPNNTRKSSNVSEEHLNFEDENMDDLFLNLFESQKFIQKTKEAISNAKIYHETHKYQYSQKNIKNYRGKLTPVINHQIIINKRCSVKIPFIKIIKGDDVIIDLSDSPNNLVNIHIPISPRIGILHKKMEIIRNNKKIILNATINICPLLPDLFGHLGNGHIVMERNISLKNYTRKMRFNLNIPGRDTYNIRCVYPPCIMPIQMIKNAGFPTQYKKTGSLIIYFKCDINANSHYNIFENIQKTYTENTTIKNENSNNTTSKYENTYNKNGTNIKEINTLPCNIISLLNE